MDPEYNYDTSDYVWAVVVVVGIAILLFCVLTGWPL